MNDLITEDAAAAQNCNGMAEVSVEPRHKRSRSTIPIVLEGHVAEAICTKQMRLLHQCINILQFYRAFSM